MQGKGLIKIIAVLLLLVSVYELIFTWKANQIEQTAKNEAKAYVSQFDMNEDEAYEAQKAYEQRYLDSLYDQKVFLNMFTYKQVKKGSLKLGLDLKGGMSVVLEADIPNLLENLANDPKNQQFENAINAARQAQKSSQADFVDLFIDNYQGADQDLIALFRNSDNAEYLGVGASKDDVRAYLKKEAEDAFKSSYDIIQSRIDRFGLEQPSIQRQDANKRILIEIPGVDNPARVRNLLQSTANLEFYEVYDNAEFSQYFMSANQALKQYLEENEKEPKASEQTVPDAIAVQEDEPALEEAADIDSLLNEERQEGKDSLELLEEAKKQFPFFQVFQPSQQAGPVVGFAAKKDTAAVNFYLSIPEVKEIFPQNAKLAWEAKPQEITQDDGTKVKIFSMLALRGDFDGNPQLDGSVIKNAFQDVDQYNNPAVSMVMNQEGAQRWYELTTKNQNKPMAIVLDNMIYSYPNINEPISGGRSQISGNFTSNEAKDLATILKTGKLDVPARIIEEEVVGPTIGKESARSGILSMVMGMAFVFVFMLIYYSRAGVIADLALLFNIVLILGILAAFGSTLTLPGIAGLVLTIGMAVDANVIIFERIKEELRKGLQLPAAVKNGYKHSYSAIIDANVTTLIIAIILAAFGVGPIKGFAVVLMIGIFTSFFTGVLLTRVMTDDRLGKGKTISYWTKSSQNWFHNFNYDFLSKRRIAYIFSGIIGLISLINLISRGGNAFDLGVDLSAGRSYTIRFNEPVKANEVKSILDEALPNTSNIVRTFGQDDQLKITTNLLIDDNSKDSDDKAISQLFEALQPVLTNGETLDEFKSENLMNSQKVDSTIADDLRNQAFWLTFAALAAIFIYLLIRFQKWEFGLAAVLTLFHDTLVMLFVYSFGRSIFPFALEVDQAFIAAVLTVIGYSINDTVIVFDRIREELQLHPNKDYKEVINMALNQTLSRTVITSFTTLIVVLSLFIFGGEVIRDFSFALLVGIIVGTYSSIFVATPIVVDLYSRFGKGKTANKK